MDGQPRSCKSKILAFRHKNPVFPRQFASFLGNRTALLHCEIRIAAAAEQA
jgi:hypothetical protein